MEQTPHHREGIQKIMNDAHEEALKDNAKIGETEAELQRLKGNFEVEEEINYESINPEKVKSLELPEMEGRPLDEVSKYVKEKFGYKYYIAGAGYREYIQHNSDKIPDTLKHPNVLNCYLGSTLITYGGAGIASTIWSSGELSNAEGVYTYKWEPSRYRVVLIERDDDVSKKATEQTSHPVESVSPIESTNAINLDYESINPEKVKLFALPEMVGKLYPEVTRYIKEKFGDRYYIPGKRYQSYLNGVGRNKRPKVFDDNTKVNFFGNDNDGGLSISEWVKITGSDASWGDDEYIVLIEK